MGEVHTNASPREMARARWHAAKSTSFTVATRWLGIIVVC